MQYPSQTRRGPWHQQEDDTLLQLVHIHGASNWVRISQLLGSRNAKQCRERYHQNLKPSLVHVPINEAEGELIKKLVQSIGKKWAEIARHLPGRSDNAVKNWYNGRQNQKRKSSNSCGGVNYSATRRQHKVKYRVGDSHPGRRMTISETPSPYGSPTMRYAQPHLSIAVDRHYSAESAMVSPAYTETSHTPDLVSNASSRSYSGSPRTMPGSPIYSLPPITPQTSLAPINPYYTSQHNQCMDRLAMLAESCARISPEQIPASVANDKDRRMSINNLLD